MPTYNSAHTIANAINSIIQQTYKDWELIIVDDGSTDNTEQVVKRFDDSRIRYFKRPHAEIVATRNYGNAQARAEWIVIQDADDLSMPDRLEKILPYTKKYDVICHALYGNIWDEAYQCMCRNYLSAGSTKDILQAQTLPGALAFRKTIWEQKPFRQEAKYSFDWMMHLDWVLSGFKYKLLDLGLYEYVRMANSASITYEKTGQRAQAIENIRKIVKDEYHKDLGTGVIPTGVGLPRP